MDVVFNIQTSKESTIMSYGVAPSHGRLLLIGGAVLLALSVSLLCLWLLLRGPFTIPRQTGILLSISPKAAQKVLPESARTLLPAVWQGALEGDSSWPVIMGAYYEQYEWRYFAIIPRWRVGTMRVRETRGLLALVSERVLPTSDHILRYADQADWKLSRWSAPLGFWVNPASLFPNASSQEDKPFTGEWGGALLRTGLPFSSATSEPLQMGDVVVNLPSHATSSVIASAILEQASVDSLPFEKAGLQVAQVRLSYTKGFIPSQIAIRFKDPIKKEQAKALLGALGIGEIAIESLPDGSLIKEKRLPLSLPESTFFGEKKGSPFKTVFIQGKDLVLGEMSTGTALRAPQQECKGLEPQAYISSRLLTRLLIPAHTSSTLIFPNAYIGVLKGKFSVCFDKE